MEHHLKWVLDTLEPRFELIRELAAVYKMDFFCGFSSGNGQGGFDLNGEMLARLARFGIPLTLNLYPPEAATSVEAHSDSGDPE
jgi:hypothetical protein